MPSAIAKGRFALSSEDMKSYREMFQACVLTNPAGEQSMLGPLCSEIISHQAIYQGVEHLAHIPWPIIAVIHFRESSLSFKCHLYNGDPLSARTVHVPKGKPTWGDPPFLWAESAFDALSSIERPPLWDIANCLAFLEKYNGFGYRLKGIPSPYLWSFSTYYKSGLFSFDSKFDPQKVDQRPGCVPILKELQARGVSFDFSQYTSKVS